MKTLSTLFLALSLSITAYAASADTLLIDALSQAPTNSASGLLRPVNGESMEMVHTRFGNPVEKLSSIGNPPITRWVYNGFTVYFEYDRVVNSAVHLDPAE